MNGRALFFYGLRAAWFYFVSLVQTSPKEIHIKNNMKPLTRFRAGNDNTVSIDMYALSGKPDKL
jgi:hypothetical protein